MQRQNLLCGIAAWNQKNYISFNPYIPSILAKTVEEALSEYAPYDPIYHLEQKEEWSHIDWMGLSDIAKEIIAIIVDCPSELVCKICNNGNADDVNIEKLIRHLKETRSCKEVRKAMVEVYKVAQQIREIM